MKKILVLALTLLSTMALAEDQGGTTSFTDSAAKYFAYFFALGLAVFSGTRAQSNAAAAALEGIARNPSAVDKIQTPMILCLALMESLVIFMLIAPFITGAAGL
ncbi:MAG: ATP synthase F0 subunit C [Bacteriovoracales bacterium]|nr:ATP synthase F0 subunit C [Bacteriovoracales bacterium]